MHYENSVERTYELFILTVYLYLYKSSYFYYHNNCRCACLTPVRFELSKQSLLCDLVDYNFRYYLKVESLRLNLHLERIDQSFH